MYKLCYYRFDEIRTSHQHPGGFDTVRNAVIGHKGYSLNRFQEAYTSERWLVRIYKVNPLPNMDPEMPARYRPNSTTQYPETVKKLKRPEA